MAKFIPIDRMIERVIRGKKESDTTYGNELLLLGEFVTKLLSVGLVAGIREEESEIRYRLMYRLVRASGLGDWATVIREISSGRLGPVLSSHMSQLQVEISKKHVSGSWQYTANHLLHECLQMIGEAAELEHRVDLNWWFESFTRLRNKTRAHGAPRRKQWTDICTRLGDSIALIIANSEIFRYQWCYIRRDLSGQYRVTPWSESSDRFDTWLTSNDIHNENEEGVYIFLDKPQRVDLIWSDDDCLDFYLPNGDFGDNHFEVISYITGERAKLPSKQFALPPIGLPESETQGLGELFIVGKSFSNIPDAPDGYIARSGLEQELMGVLSDDRHPVITLVGRGGIGKTSLALHSLHRLAQSEQFDNIIWFSARDIDLMTTGPKIVRQHIVSEKDIASELVRLIAPNEAKEKGFNPIAFLAKALERPMFGRTLFVLDNFETVKEPITLYQFLNNFIRLPNKILITTRHREFKADYPVEVKGMDFKETQLLTRTVAADLGISHLITKEYLTDLFNESDGHPYVIKVLLGELAKEGKPTKISRIIARQDDMLDALFDRTYKSLSPRGKRIFLTLCGWRAAIPLIALEAVLLRPQNKEKIGVSDGIEELRRYSFIEITSEETIRVPLSAFLFGKGKLEVSRWKNDIENDVLLLLNLIGPSKSATRFERHTRIERMFWNTNEENIGEYKPILEFIAANYSPAWIMLAKLYERIDPSDKARLAKAALESYLRANLEEQDLLSGWIQLAEYHKRHNDPPSEAFALVEACKTEEASIGLLSTSAHRINFILSNRHSIVWDREDRDSIVNSLIGVMDEHKDKGDATYLSRLAWLCINSKKEEQAKHYTKLGISRDPNNYYCNRLADRLGLTVNT
jgi:hypothetical protein